MSLPTKNKSTNYRNHFSKRNNTTKCDAIFVFGGSHPGNWQAPLEAYRQGLEIKLSLQVVLVYMA